MGNGEWGMGMEYFPPEPGDVASVVASLSGGLPTARTSPRVGIPARWLKQNRLTNRFRVSGKRRGVGGCDRSQSISLVMIDG